MTKAKAAKLMKLILLEYPFVKSFPCISWWSLLDFSGNEWTAFTPQSQSAVHPHALLASSAHGQNYKHYVLRYDINSTNSVHSWPEVTTCRCGSSKSIQPLAKVGESTFAISSAHAYGINRFIWRTEQQTGSKASSLYSALPQTGVTLHLPFLWKCLWICN